MSQTMRLAVLVPMPDGSGPTDETGHLGFVEGLRSRGCAVEVHRVTPEPLSWHGPSGGDDDPDRVTSAQKTAARRRATRRFARRTARLLGLGELARTCLATVRQIQLRMRRRAIRDEAEEAVRVLRCGRSTGGSSAADSVALWQWYVDMMTATYALPTELLGEEGVHSLAQTILERHAAEPVDAVVAVGHSARLAAIAHVLSRVTGATSVVDAGLRADLAGAIPSPVSLVEERALYAADAVVALSDEGAAEAIIAAAAAPREREMLPVLTAVIEHAGAVEPVLRTLASIQSSSLPDWEALVVVDESAPTCNEIASAVEALGDARIRVLGTPLEPFEYYPARIQHAARAEYLVRLTPGVGVGVDFVALAAGALLTMPFADGLYWTGSRMRTNGRVQDIRKGIKPIRLSLLKIVRWWYSLEGEYVMNRRMFSIHGGFTHVPAGRHSTAVQQIALLEAAAFKGTMFHAEVPLAYRRMAGLSRNLRPDAVEVSPGDVDCVDLPDHELFIYEEEQERTVAGKYTGKTVAFVRHVLVPWDARILKEASALAAEGAHIIVAGAAEQVPVAMRDAGYEVITTPDRANLSAISGPLAAARPDIIHAYDVNSYDAVQDALGNEGVKLVYECRDLHASLGYLTEDRQGAAFDRERELARRAEAVIAVSPPVGEWLETAYAIDTVTSILHGSATVVRDAVPAHEPVRLFFQGALRPNRGLFAMISAMSRLQGRATMSLQGFSVMDNALRAYVDELELSASVEFLPVCGPLDVVRSASRFDVGIMCFAGTTDNTLRATPNKLMDYMAAGLAVVAPDLPGVRSVADEATGALFRPGSARELADAIERLISDRNRLAQCKAESLSRAKGYRWDVEKHKLLDIYDRTLGVVS